VALRLMARTGRRAGAPDTRAAILGAARSGFAEHGYDRTTIRGVARAASVDPALVHHYFGTKEGLFTAAMELPVDPASMVPSVIGPGPVGVGERLVRMFLTVWDSPAGRAPLLALIRSAVTHEASAAMLRQFLTRAVFGRVVAGLDVDRRELRASLVASQMVGLAVTRYILRLEPLASAPPDVVVAMIAPTVQRYLTAPLD